MGKVVGYEWRHRIDITNAWHACEEVLSSHEEDSEESITAIRLLASIIANKLLLLPKDSELSDLITEMRHVTDQEHFNMIMDQLYDWADKDKRLWIQHF